MMPSVKGGNAFNPTISAEDQDFELVPAAKVLPPDAIPLP
jgi:hypothetical protein